MTIFAQPLVQVIARDIWLMLLACHELPSIPERLSPQPVENSSAGPSRLGTPSRRDSARPTTVDDKHDTSDDGSSEHEKSDASLGHSSEHEKTDAGIDSDLLDEVSHESDASNSSDRSAQKAAVGPPVKKRGRPANEPRLRPRYTSQVYAITPETVLAVTILSLLVARVPFMLVDIVQ